MNFNVLNTKICIDFSFFLLLSFAVFYGYKNAAWIILFSCLHEMGHLISLLLFKVQPQKIKVSFYGISLKYDNKLSKYQEILVFMSGPLMNLILFFIFKDIINLALFLINLYPVMPLDGGRIIYAISEKASKVITAVFLLVLIFIAVYSFWKFKNFSVILITVYLVLFNLNQMRFV